MKPKRIQLKRTKGWRMPPNTVKVDRTTKWGNPLIVTPGVSAETVVESFKEALLGSQKLRELIGIKFTVEDARRELRGKNLACWCRPGKPCHADVLLEISNQLTASPYAAQDG